MGYPMTYQRVINRNRLARGGYDDAADQRILVALDGHGLLEPRCEHIDADGEAILLRWKYAKEELQGKEHAMKMLLGDLRRLEQDSVDEQATCEYIAVRTGIEPSTVAAVLKEFMAW